MQLKNSPLDSDTFSSLSDQLHTATFNDS